LFPAGQLSENRLRFCPAHASLSRMPEWPAKEFWDERYREGKTPWDYGRVPPEFQEYLSLQPPPLRLLVPGCGSGYEIAAAVELGHDAVGIDLSDQAVVRARGRLGAVSHRALVGDFFKHRFEEASFDLIYERTFLCALPPALRPDYVGRMQQLLKPGGLLAGYFIYGTEPEPPPYPLAPGEENELIAPFFELIESRPSKEPLPLFAGMERWQVWRRR
jgi:SAM-dependent methyltransferase